MQPVGVDRDGGAALEPAEEEDGTAGTHEVERVAPRLFRPRRLDDDVGAAAVTRLGTELARELASAADRDGTCTGVGDARAEHQADRAGADHGDGVFGPYAGTLDAVQAAGERLDHRRDLRRESVWDGEEIDAGHSLRHDEPLGVRAVQEMQVGAVAVRVCRDDSPAVLGEAAELVPERSRRIAEQNGMAAPERLQVGAVRQRDLDAYEDVAVAGLRARDVLDAYVTRGVEARRPHGVNTTLSASRRRNSSSPSANLSSGRTIGSGTSSSGRSAAASRIAAGVPEREPT